MIPLGVWSFSCPPYTGCLYPLEVSDGRVRPRRPRRPRRTSPSVLERINPDAAGIDCGATTHVVAVPPDRDDEPVQSFRTFTTDLQRLAELARGVPRHQRGAGIDRRLLDSRL